MFGLSHADPVSHSLLRGSAAPVAVCGPLGTGCAFELGGISASLRWKHSCAGMGPARGDASAAADHQGVHLLPLPAL